MNYVVSDGVIVTASLPVGISLASIFVVSPPEISLKNRELDL
jgi:hypothetical protein